MKNLSRKELYKVGIVFGIIVLVIVFALSGVFRTLFLNIDLLVFNFFRVSDLFVPLMKIITMFGNWELVILISLIMGYFMYKKDKRYTIIFISSLVVTQGIIFILKEVYHRARPPLGYIVETGYSFPSGHATTSLVFYVLLSYFIIMYGKSYWRFVLSSLLVVLAILISLSRLVLNVHWFSDIVLGFFVALSIIIITLSGYHELKK